MRAFTLWAGAVLVSGVQNPALGLQTPAGVQVASPQKSHAARKTHSARTTGGRALQMSAPFDSAEIITEGLEDVPMSSERFAKEEARIAKEESTGNSIVPEIVPGGAEWFANEEARIAKEEANSKSEAPGQQEIDPAAERLRGSKRLKQKWDTDILPTLPKAEWAGDRPTNTSCVSIDVGTADSWCQTMCATTTVSPTATSSSCPEATCKCDAESVAKVKEEYDEVIANWKEAEARVRTAEPDVAYPDGLPHFEDSKPTPDLPTRARRDHLSADPNTCRAIHVQVTDHWCATQCATEDCPLTLCKCDDLAAPEETGDTVVNDEWSGTPYEITKDGSAADRPPIQSGRVKSLQPATCRAVREDATDEYCVILCATQDCPLDLCKCADTPTMEEVKEATRRSLQSPSAAVPSASETDASADPNASSAETEMAGLKSLAATCYSTVSSDNPGAQFSNDLWCKTTCANHNCPKAQCECGAGMEYVTEKRVWQHKKWGSSKDEEIETPPTKKLKSTAANQHGPKWNAKHDPQAEEVRKEKVSHHRKGDSSSKHGPKWNAKAANDDAEQSDDEESDDDAKHAKNQHAKHAKHTQHVKHGQHAQKALDRMQTDYAQRKQTHKAQHAISARKVNEAAAPTADIAWNERPTGAGSRAKAEVHLGGGARFMAGSARRAAHQQ